MKNETDKICSGHILDFCSISSKLISEGYSSVGRIKITYDFWTHRPTYTQKFITNGKLDKTM